MNYACSNCGIELDKQKLFNTKEGASLCAECFETGNGEEQSVIQKVFDAMVTDSDGNDKQSEILQNEYMAASIDQQKAIDRIFIALCGSSLKTLIEGHEATVSYNPYK